MSTLTVDELKSALASKGIKVPPNSKKNTYIKLYKEHVAPLHNIKISERYNQFSSDDEESSSRQITISKSKITSRMSENSFEDLDVSNLQDEELFERLSKLGVSVGPIVDSTRKIYQRKLVRMMGGDVVDSFNGEVLNGDEYSDNDSEPEEVNMGNKSSGLPEGRVTSNYASPLSSSNIRQRETTTGKNYGGSSKLDSSLSFDHDRHTPSPRPSLRTVTSTTTKSTKYVTSGGNVRESQSTRYTYLTPKSDDDDAAALKKAYVTRLIVKFTFILILIAALSIAYQYMYSESPFKGLENLAKQALDSANEGTKKGAKTSSKS